MPRRLPVCWAKFGALGRRGWRQTGWVGVLGGICSPCIVPGSPRVAFKVTFFLSSEFAEVGIAALVLVSLTRQQPHQLQSQHSILTAPAFNANRWWCATRQFLSQVLNLFILSSGLILQGKGTKCHQFSLNPISEIFNNSLICKARALKQFWIFFGGKKNPVEIQIMLLKKNLLIWIFSNFEVLRKILGEEEIRGRVENISSFLPFFQCLHNYWLKGKTVLKATRQLIKIF